MTARSRHHRPRRVLGRVLGLVLAMVVAATLAPSGAAAGTAAPRQDGDGQDVRLVSQTMWHGPGDRLVVRFEVDDAGADDDVRLELYAALESRADVRRVADGQDPGATLRLAPVVPVSSLEASDGVVQAELEIDDELLPGVYPWSIRVGDGAPVASFAAVLPAGVVPPPDPGPGDDTSPTTADGDTSPAGDTGQVGTEPAGDDADGVTAQEVTPLRVTPVLTMPRELRTDGTGAVPTAATVAAVDRFAAMLVEVADVTLDVVLAPALFDSLDIDRRDRLVDILADDRTVADTYVPLSPVSWVGDGLDDELVVQLEAGRSTLTSLFGDAVGTTTLVTDGAIDSASLAVLADAGIERVVLDDDRLVALDPERFGDTAVRSFALQTADGDALATVALDGGVARALGEGDPMLTAHRIAAELTLVYLDDPDALRGVAFRIHPGNGDHVIALLAVVRSSPVLELTGLGALFDEVPASGRAGGVASTDGDVLVRQLVPATREDLEAYAARLRETSSAVDSYAGLLVGSSPRIDSLRRRLLLSGAEYLSEESRQALLTNVQREVDQGVSGVTIPLPSRFTFTSRTGTIPLQIVNELTEPLTVSLELRSAGAQLDFPMGSAMPLTLEPGINRVDVPVRTRTSGDSPLTLRITTPDGRLVLTEGRVTIRSTALSGVGIGIAVAAVLVLVAWWIRHHRGRPRRPTAAP